MVIFGAWDVESDLERAVILKEDWKTNAKDRRQPGYTQAIEHIEYVNQGYDLYTFNMLYSERVDNTDVAAIKDFEPKLHKRYLRKEGDIWYADFSANPFPNEIPSSESYIEGAKSQVTVNSYERDPKARQACIDHHGTSCKCCGFNFEQFYGEHGKGFIHVHHIKPLHTLGDNYEVDPVHDLIPLCPNCHAMVHRGSNVLLITELKEKIDLTNSTKP